MALAIAFRQNRFVRKLNDWYSRLSLRARIAGTMIALVASAGLVLSAWAYLADEQLKRNITLDLLSEELTHFEQRMRVDRGAEPLRSARLAIYRSSDLAELPRHIAMLKPGEMHRVRSGGRLLDVLVRDGDFGRLYITYDVTTYATQDAIALLVLGIGVIAIVMVAALAASAISRRLVEPVTALAARLTEIDPGERHVRIGAQFAGNELEPIARSVDMFMERLDGFVEREQSFTATASHELRTPLAVMRGAVELLETSAADRPGAGKALARIQRAVREMTEFTDALLALSREQQAAAASETTCDVNAVLARVVEDQRSVSPGKRIVLEIETGTKLQVAAPESMVAMTIGNLVRNAVQHGTGGEVLCRSQGHELVVTNAGTLPTENLSAAPRRFTTHPGGHGMGLYLVRRICERYGWDIRLENGPRGVTARVGFA
ncbi:MAG TPA: HAMP domain-containing sensor histidine kinase [Steroidobacteraceae bacterium]|jgi:signal transduction histidine kinase|nr:HAMP domain-containing sensor histidine kinase [Steroidobacteraceae bacterium]